MREIRQNREAKSFLLKCAIFLAPFMVLLGVPFVILWASGELSTVDQVIHAQMSQQKVLYGLAYSDVTPYYKLHSVIAKDPKILALGASTVMQFSSKLFTEPNTFFNAGGSIAKLSDFDQFMNLVPQGKKPTILLIGLSEMYFKPGFSQPPEESALTSEILLEEKFFSKWWVVWSDLLNDKISLTKIFGDSSAGTIGLQAVMKDSGFNNDGSYNWGVYVDEEKAGTLTQNRAKQLDATLADFSAHGSPYAGGSEPDQSAIEALDSFLADMHAQHIYVIGFLPPQFPHAIYVQLKDPKNNAGYLYVLADRLKPIFGKYGYPIFDFEDLASFGSSDAEIYDTSHATRKAYARILLNMAQHDIVLQKEVDVQQLAREIQASTSTLDIF